MATKYHKDLTGPDLHANAIDGTTGTELSVASQAAYDARWVKGQSTVSAAIDTVTNTTTETNFSPTYIAAASGLTVGRVIRVTARGIYSTLGTSPGNLTVRVKLGSTVICSNGGPGATAAMTNKGWQIQCDIIVATTGVSGTVEGQGYNLLNTSSSTAQVLDLENTTTVPIDITQSQTVQISAQWSVASASNAISIRQFIVEVRG